MLKSWSQTTASKTYVQTIPGGNTRRPLRADIQNFLLGNWMRLRVGLMSRKIQKVRSPLSWSLLKIRDNFGVSSWCEQRGDKVWTGHCIEVTSHPKEGAIYMSIADDNGFIHRKSWMPVQVLWYSNGEEEVPIVTIQELFGELVSIDDAQELIDAIERYKELFTEKDIRRHSLVLKSNGHTAVEHYPDYEGLINCRKKQSIGYVYLINAVDLRLFKIGYSKKPEYRLQQLSKQQIPSRLSMVCKIATANMATLEKELHEKYKHQRRYGEWFELTHQEVEEIKVLSDKSGDD